MVKTRTLLAAAVALAALSLPAMACERHKDGHAALTTAAAQSEAVTAPAAVTQAPRTTKAAAAPASVSEPAGYRGCMRGAKAQTVYLTQ